ncbi:uncharacterized protein BJX67DRAFT_383757 [Aspergillus lucknowensis]|uniref:Uncharacterized protein n=1 Tax=Aspergillus lucknowensis TaxID=176173 RepID=A0ABR4LIY2_9EURO
MRLTAISLTLLLSPLAALATPNLAAETNNAILKRSPTPMKPLMARGPGQSPANLLARSPRPDDDDEDDDVSCASDERQCGSACVPEDYNCCPSEVSGGCPRDEECQEDNGRWGCCPEGDDCSWDDDDDNDDDDDDDDDVFDRIEDFGDDVKDGWDDFWDGDDDDAAGMLKPGVGVALVAAVVAAVLPY